MVAAGGPQMHITQHSHYNQTMWKYKAYEILPKSLYKDGIWELMEINKCL